MPDEPHKLSHKMARYGKGHADGEHCGNCVHWEAKTKTCGVVASPMTYGTLGWSRLWSPKKASPRA